MSRLWPGGTDTDYLTIPASALWDFNTNIVIMAIVRYASALGGPGNSHYVVNLGSFSGSRGFAFGVQDDSGELVLQGMPSSYAFAGTGCVIAQNVWAAICVIGNNGSAAQFKRYNYTAMTTATSGGTTTIASALNTDPGVIGQFITPSTTNPWSGDIDRVLIGQHSGTPPSDAEFQAWARAGTLPPTVTVKGYWVLSPSGTATSPEVDLSGNGLNITSISGTTASAAFDLPDAFTGQVARPSADVTIGTWTTQSGGTTNLYQTLVDPSETNYIRSVQTPSSAVYVAGPLVWDSPYGTPAVPGDPHVVKWTYGKDLSVAESRNLTVELRSGYTSEGSPGTLIATVATLTNIAAHPISGSYTLTGTEATNARAAQSSLYCRFVAN